MGVVDMDTTQTSQADAKKRNALEIFYHKMVGLSTLQYHNALLIHKLLIPYPVAYLPLLIS